MTKKEAIVKSICCHLEVVLKSQKIANNPDLSSALTNLRNEMHNYEKGQNEAGCQCSITQDDFEIIDCYISVINDIQKGLDKESDELSWLKCMANLIKYII